MKKILVQVPVCERLPTNDKFYHVEGNYAYYSDEEWRSIEGIEIQPKYWYDVLEVQEGESKKILPDDERNKFSLEPQEGDINYLLNIQFWKYHKALQVAEDEIIYLKASKSMLRKQLKSIANLIVEANKKGKQERYKKALEYAENNMESYQGEVFSESALSYKYIEEALKIAAGLSNFPLITK